MDKKKALAKHTSKRLFERYGLKSYQHIIDSIISQIKKNRGIFIYRQSLRVTVWDVVYNVQENDIADSNIAKIGETTIRVVYDKNRNTIITVLPVD